jgi:hypothetical protein
MNGETASNDLGERAGFELVIIKDNETRQWQETDAAFANNQ